MLLLIFLSSFKKKQSLRERVHEASERCICENARRCSTHVRSEDVCGVGVHAVLIADAARKQARDPLHADSAVRSIFSTCRHGCRRYRSYHVCRTYGRRFHCGMSAVRLPYAAGASHMLCSQKLTRILRLCHFTSASARALLLIVWSQRVQRSPSATSTLESTIIGACSTTYDRTARYYTVGRAFFSHQPRGAATKMSLCVSKAVRGLMLARTLTLSQFHRTRRLFVARDGDILY